MLSCMLRFARYICLSRLSLVIDELQISSWLFAILLSSGSARAIRVLLGKWKDREQRSHFEADAPARESSIH